MARIFKTDSDAASGRNAQLNAKANSAPFAASFGGAKPRARHFVEFWAVLILPWILDTLATRAVLSSVFGACVWGVGLALSVARLRTREPRFRRAQGVALIAVIVLWAAYWTYSFGELRASVSAATAAPRPDNLEWLLISHAGLLAAGAGAVAVLMCASLLWLAQERSLRRNSWQRRESRWRLPSLESLGKVSRASANLAFAAWGIGFFLAFLSAVLRWQSSGHEAGDWRWVGDTKVIATALLWLVLAATFQASHLLSPARRAIHTLYFCAGLLFWGGFFYGIMMGHHSALHMPLRWFGK